MIKKLIFFLAPLIFWIGAARAQNVEFGIKGGLNIAGAHNNFTNNTDDRISVAFGGLAHIHLNKTMAIQPELLYSCQGARQTTDGNQFTWRLNYVNIPVLFQYMFGNGFRVETGPQLGLLASAKLKSGGTLVDIKNDYTTGDFSWGIGAGYISPLGIGIDARYNLGINNINNTGNSDKVQNRVFGVGLFYQFSH